MPVTGYLPVSLEGVCNAGLSTLGPKADVQLGPRAMRGIPFELAKDPMRCFVVPVSGRPVSVALPVGTFAKWIVVAHRVVGSEVLHGGPVGATVGRYLFRHADGGEVSAPIRERLEVSVVQTSGDDWGQLPFLAVPDRFDAQPPRHAGPFAATGHRLTDLEMHPTDFFLWAWRNASPEKALAAIELHGEEGGARLVVAGITLGMLDEHPLRLPPAQPLKVELLGDARRVGEEIAVIVDRGLATYTHVLASAGLEEFRSDPLKGWGEPRNLSGNPVYTTVAALPSATVAVRQGDEIVGRAVWGDLEAKRTVETEHVRIQLLESGRNWVRTTIVDDATGSPIAARIHFRSAEGVPYQPHGHHQHVNSDLYEVSTKLGTESAPWNLDVGGDLRLGRLSYAYVDGVCEGWLPRGNVLVDVAQGFEYEPLRSVVAIEPGQRQLTLRLKRLSDVSKDGWFSGDTHVHFLSVDGAHLEARGEGLNVVNLLATQWGRLFTNTEDLTGRPSVSGDGRSIVYVSQENRQHLLGHLSLLGLKRPVMPWCSDGPSEAELGGSLETGLAHWADRCHEQGGVVVLPHFPNPNGEPAALVATHRVDAVEFVDFKEYSHREYYRYLNAGYRLPLVGGTDKMSGDVPVGLSRTYVRIPPTEPFTYDSWCRAIVHGRTFMSSGPLISITVDGAVIGDTVRLPRAGGTVHLKASVSSIFPIHTLEIVQGGRVVATASSRSGARALEVREDVTVTADTWFVARAAGPGYTPALRHRDDWSRAVMAHTSPVYVACNDEWRMHDPAATNEMLTLVDGGLRYIRDLSPQWSDASVTHHHGETDHRGYLERPFLEAQRALKDRLRS